MAPDPTAWVYHYTEDAVFIAPGGPPISGRTELLKMAKAMKPISSVMITPIKTEISGNMAAVYVRASWVSDPKANPPNTVRARNLIVWRKESDGKWRVSMELLHDEPPAKTP
jgi:ketosteroid isomerase-like protein